MLVFTSEPLQAPLDVLGPVHAVLTAGARQVTRMSSSAYDVDPKGVHGT